MKRATLISALVLTFAVSNPVFHAFAGDKKGSPAYSDVQKDAKKYLGQKVTWVGSQATYSSTTDEKGKTIGSYIYLWQDERGKIVADHPFVFSDKNLKRTAAATKADNTPGDPGIRIVSGTVKGIQEVAFSNGRKVQAPILEEVTIDGPPSKNK